ncbi:uncharacterized protein [Zea mays]|uniref:Chloroplast thylakoid membrane n=1 Tax=Zea mays TaxID=4577 RepID=A0A1D6L6D5_MAIZE|nr:uncharacterized protein LOC100383751 isoform X1 [Zea mays]ONM09867.1 hypothetical protein ZEAMMB73_Zm00001d034248 [Zea mays]
MSAIHSPAAPPARPPFRRSTTGVASPLREPSQPQPTPPAPPSLTSRRAGLVALLVAAVAPERPAAAAAFSLGIPGPKELLREQKKKSASFLLAPIAASRDTLVKAHALLASPSASTEDAEEVKGRILAAGRDCVPRQRNSIVALQSRTGVEVCTFSLILKNAASLLANKDSLKVEADTRLEELIKSFSELGTLVENSNFELADDREKIKDGLLSSVSALDKFEQSVKDCLGV